MNKEFNPEEEVKRLRENGLLPPKSKPVSRQKAEDVIKKLRKRFTGAV